MSSAILVSVAFMATLACSVCSATNGHFDELKDRQLAEIRTSVSFLAKYVEKPDKKESELLLKHAREIDGEDCLLRTLCDIVATPETEEESTLVKKFRSIFSRGFENETVHFKKETYVFPYKYAAYIGSTQADEPERTCFQTFPVCTIKHEAIMTLINNLAQNAKI